MKKIKKLPQAITVEEFKKKLHKKASLLMLKDDFPYAYEREDFYAKHFPKIHAIKEGIKKQFDDVLNGDMTRYAYNQYAKEITDRWGIHPAVQPYFNLIEKVRDWQGKMKFFHHVSLSSVMDDDCAVDLLKQYARKTFKSTLNY
jgi:hypothetical protein